jgi:hypothetical protein
MIFRQLFSKKSFLKKSLSQKLLKFCRFRENPPACPKTRDLRVYLKAVGDFGNSASHFPNPRAFLKTRRSQPKSCHWGGGGGGWLGLPSCTPSPAVNSSSFCLVLLSCWRSGFFYWCKLSLRSLAFWSSHSHPGMATNCCSVQIAASTAQGGYVWGRGLYTLSGICYIRSIQWIYKMFYYWKTYALISN